MGYRRINGFYIEENEEHLIKYIMPEYYVDSNLDDLDAGFVLTFLQNELNGIINSFLNGGFSNVGYALYPIIKDISGENAKKIWRLR